MHIGNEDFQSNRDQPVIRSPIEAEIEPRHDPRPGKIRASLQFVRAHPWISMFLLLVLGLAMGVIFGLPVEVAQVYFVAGLILLGLGRLVVYRCRQPDPSRDPLPPENVPQPVRSKGFWGQFANAFGATLAFCTFAMLIHGHNQSQRTSTLPPVQAISKQSSGGLTTGSKTQQYWQTAIAALHPHRFDAAQDSKGGALRDWRRRLDEYRSVVSRAQAASVSDVDLDLVAMAQRHFEVDNAYLKRQEGLLKATTDLAPNPQALAAMERLSFDELVNRIAQAAQDGQLPKDVHESWKATVDRENLEKSFFEIEVMQARLQERYKADGRLFLLPGAPDVPGDPAQKIP